MSTKWKSTGTKGIRYYEHPTRKRGINMDRYFSIRYVVAGKRTEEGIGWDTDIATEFKKAKQVATSEEDKTKAKAKSKNAKEEAERRMSELRENRRRGEGPRTLKEKKKEHEVKQALQKAESLTLSEFWETDYLQNLKHRVKESSWEKEVEHYTNRIKTPMGHKPLKTITNVDVDKMLDDMRKEGLSPRTQQYAVGTLHRIWKHAAKRKYVKAGDNPATGVTLQKVNNTRLRVFTPQELQDILKYLDTSDKAAYDLTLFCAFIGCRFSDAAKLTWEHVDLNRDTATFTDTKNKDTRTVYLILEVVEMLKKRGIGRPGEYVFTMRAGTPWTEPPSAFRTAIEKLNLNEGRGKRDIASFHTLRHTAATFAARRGVPVKDMQIIFGWKTPSMVFRYAKGDEDTQRRAMSGLAESLTPEQGKIVELFRKG